MTATTEVGPLAGTTPAEASAELDVGTHDTSPGRPAPTEQDEYAADQGDDNAAPGPAAAAAGATHWDGTPVASADPRPGSDGDTGATDR